MTEEEIWEWFDLQTKRMDGSARSMMRSIVKAAYDCGFEDGETEERNKMIDLCMRRESPE